MKNIFKGVFVAALAFAAVACNKAVPEKSEVEAGFVAKAPVPTAVIDAESFSSDGLTATVKVSFTGITKEAMDSLSIGLVYGTDPTFASSKFEAVEDLKDGSYTLTVNAVTNTKMYFMAAAANVGGTCYSEVLEKDIPDLPFHVKVVGTYVGNVVSSVYDDGKYTQAIEIIVDEKDPTVCIVSGFEPYYLKKYGLKYPDGNYCIGTIDDETSTITIPKGSYLNLYEENDSFVVGVDSDSFKTAENIADITFKSTADGNLYRYEAFGPQSMGEDGKYTWEDQYAGDVTYVKQ